VNNEEGELDSLLRTGPDLVAPGGRMVVIAFMSLEDRKVKHRFRELAQQGRAVILTKRPLEPTDEEVRENPASRSAKLRAVEMV
jgi:16S rRNA (cytosine1402-N4)-methyltransferase